MGYFDAISSGYFKTAPTGQTIFFPWGRLGRGYEVTVEEYAHLKSGIGTFTVVGLASAVLLPGLTLKATGALALICLYAIWGLIWRRGRVSSTEKLSRQEVQTNVAGRMPTWLIATFIVFGSLMLLLTAVVVVADHAEPGVWLIGVIFGSFWGLCLWSFVRMLRRKTAIKKAALLRQQ